MSDRINELAVGELSERLRITEANLQERISELEYELEERGWDRLYGSQDLEFSRDALRRICRESRLFYLKNPLIARSIDLENAYVFGQGLTIQADHPLVDEVVQSFISDELNRSEITTPRAMTRKNADLKIDGNLFIAFFTNDAGDVRVRTIPFDEIQDVISNPEDAAEPWFYVRRRLPRSSILQDIAIPAAETLHPDWQYTPPSNMRQMEYRGIRIDWDHPVYHVSVNRLSGQRFGLSEVYAAQDWARAYNEFLANWATITRALARFAWKVVTKGGPTQRAAVKSVLDSGISSDQYNPAPAAGSSWIESEAAVNLQPIKTAGATTSPADGRRLLLMVAAAMGWPETFYGDADVGTLATAKSLDRPSELTMLGKQRLWTEIIENITSYAIEQKARASQLRELSGQEMEDDWGEMKWYYADDPETGDPINIHISIDFPDIVERSVTERVDAVVKAATLGGMGTFAGTLDAEYTTRQLLSALGEKSVEEVMSDFFPEDEEQQAQPLPQVEALRKEMAGFLTLLKETHVRNSMMVLWEPSGRMVTMKNRQLVVLAGFVLLHYSLTARLKSEGRDIRGKYVSTS